MKVMLTGGSGMVGRNIMEHPNASSFRFLGPTRDQLDLYNYTTVLNYIQYHQPDIIIHAAGTVGGIQANIKHPLRFFTENLEVGKNVVTAAAAAGVPRLINLGSSCMYPRSLQTGLTENQILTGELEPTNEGYALAKIAVQRLCQYIGSENPMLQYKTIIPCNIFGRWDKFAPEHSHLVPGVIQRLHDAKLNNRPFVEIWGDGTARREFMYAGDLADALMRTLTHYESIPAVMNAGLGFDYSINEYYAAIAKVVGYRGAFTHDLSKPVGMSRKLCNVGRLTDWGWVASTSLNDGIQTAYDFYLKNTLGAV